MHLLSIFFHTTGDQPEKHQIIELGAVLDDPGAADRKPVNELPSLRLIIRPAEVSPAPDSDALMVSGKRADIIGDSFMLSKCAGILARIGNTASFKEETDANKWVKCLSLNALDLLFKFMNEHSGEKPIAPLFVMAAPVTSLRFMQQSLHGTENLLAFPCIDPASFLYQPGDPEGFEQGRGPESYHIYPRVGVNLRDLVERSFDTAGDGTLLVARAHLEALRKSKNSLYANLG